MKNILSLIQNTEEKKRLRDAINRKKKESEQLMRKIEDLKWQLTEIQHQYLLRIGKLYIQIDRLNQEITTFRRLELLLRKGFTVKQAKQILMQREEANNTERKNFHTTDYISMPPEDDDTPDDRKDQIKKLYRKLIPRYHPDLSQDRKEKKMRENMMKRINKAYQEHNLEVLKAIDEERRFTDHEADTIEFLRKKLEEQIQVISSLQKEYRNLLYSEWYTWKKKIDKAKKNNKDIFKELEEELLEIINLRKATVTDLQNQYDKK